MTLKVFRGRHVSSVLSRIRDEVGEDALILSTRQCGTHEIEITVGLEQGAVEPGVASALAATQSHVVGNLALKPELQPSSEKLLIERLSLQGIEGKLASDILRHAAGHENSALSVEIAAANGVAGCFKFENRLPFKSRAVALIGATGVGKTTTIAKLAAQVQEAFGLKVGLVSADTFRVGAQFHLKTYAALMHAPFVAIDSSKPFAAELSRALDALKSADLVLIDTAGCSPHDQQRLSDMAAGFEVNPEVERLLVLPAPSNKRDLQIAGRAFQGVGYSRVVLSKIDESAYLGEAAQAAREIDRPLAFFTTGQRVPEDIEPATARRLGWMLTRVLH